MQTCWQPSPGNRASLRELRIMLLHLHSASRGDPDTAAFDQKWNQLMPRQLMTAAEDPSASSGNNSAHAESARVVDVDLGTIRPAGFESDFAETSTSPNHVHGSGNSGAQSKTPVNEISLAAELGTFVAFESARSDGDVKYMHADAESSHVTRAHINVHAEVHCDTQPTDSLNVPLTDSMDITDQLSSLNAESFGDSALSQTERYASYLKTVSTSVIEGDDDMIDDSKSKDLLPSEAFESNDPDSIVESADNAT